MESLRLNETWQLQPLPEGRRQIRNNLADLCVYRRSEEDGIVILAIWVNDGLLCGPDENQIIGTKEQLADLLTKALAGPAFQDLRRKISVHPILV